MEKWNFVLYKKRLVYVCWLIIAKEKEIEKKRKKVFFWVWSSADATAALSGDHKRRFSRA
jgi:hypothetical protein